MPSSRVLRRLALTALLTASLISAAPSTVPRPAAPAPSRDRGTNLLVVGLDRRTGMSRSDIQRLHVGGKECDCTDVMMLVHIAPGGRRLGVVSIPRDSYVPFARHDGHGPHSGKINGAFAEGGADLAVRTVEKATGVPIDHYLEADFLGFVEAVDRLGGAEVCTSTPLSDLNSGLDLAPGTHAVDGGTALRYVRARHVSPPGDLGRVRRQQRLLLGMLARLSDAGAFTDPLATGRTARALARSVRTDENTSLGTLYAWGRALRRLDLAHTEFATVPMSDFDHQVPGWGSTLLWDEPRAKALFDAVREDRSLVQGRPAKAVPVDQRPGTVRVRVDDPATADGLRANGFDVRAVDPSAGRAAGPTVITYDPVQARYVDTLAAALPGSRLRQVTGQGPVFRVAVGAAKQQVAKVTYDRSMVEGAPVTGDRLRCG
ncbi:LCP family protein [Streptomyces kanamyceticus]|uniref:LCP family protein n=1 Tax=Streptomyces kanamyceticus TaxID=1967 RepID=UPI0006E2F89D|nr:LCP family protein [Streptomyces kanamyceticus]